MTQLFLRFERRHMAWLVNSLVFLFFVTVLTFKKGYSYAPMALAGIGIIYLFIHIFKLKKPLNFTKEDKWLIFAFVFYFGTFAFSAIYHGDGFREIDNPSRLLLFLPLLLLFREFPINIKVILHGIPVGAAVVGLIGIYQKFYLGQPRAYTEFMAIQGGDIAMSLGLLSLIVSIYFLIEREFKLFGLYLVCTILGVMGSGLSGSRGAWIAMPIIILLLLFLFRYYLKRKVMASIIFSMITFCLILFFIPQTNIKTRVIESKNEFVNYIVHKKDSDTSVGGRFELWNTALIGIKEKPILGWGNKEYLKLKEKLVKQKVVDWFTLRFNDAHNQYLDSMVKRGVVGFVGLLSIILIPLFYFFRVYRGYHNEMKLLPVMAIVHIVSSMIYFLTQSFLNHNSGSIFYFFMIIIMFNLCRVSKKT